MKDALQTLGQHLLNTLLPPRCVASGDIVDVPGMISPKFWAELNFIEDPYCVCCGLPFEYEIEADSLCAQCLGNPPPFDKLRTVFRYDDASRKLILKFKHGDQTHIVPSFTTWLSRVGESLWMDVDLITPVPLHRFRLWQRRYNQSALITESLAKRVEKAYCLDLLERHRATPSQKGLSQDGRKRNVRGAFRLREKYKNDIAGKTIVLIDDVYTSGATMTECARVLKRAGAKTVYALALARVV